MLFQTNKYLNKADVPKKKKIKKKTKAAVLYCNLLVVQWIDWIPFTSLTYVCTVVYVLNLRTNTTYTTNGIDSYILHTYCLGL